MKSGTIKDKFEYFQLRNFSELVVTAFCFSEKLYFLKIVANLAAFGGKSIEKFCKFHAMILLSETLPERDLEKTRILWINERNYSVFFFEVGFDEIFEQNSSFHWYFHTFLTKISSKTPESVRRSQRKLLFWSKISSKTDINKKSWRE